MDRPELRDEMARRLAGAAGAFETGYTGALHVRPVGRGLILQDAADRRHVEEWVEQALRDAGLLNETDTWAAGGRTTEPVRLTLRIERPPAP